MITAKSSANCSPESGGRIVAGLNIRLDFLAGFFGIARPPLFISATDDRPQYEIDGQVERIVLPASLVADGADEEEARYLLEHEFSHYLCQKHNQNQVRRSLPRRQRMFHLAKADPIAELYRHCENLLRDQVEPRYLVSVGPPYVFNLDHLRYASAYDLEAVLQILSLDPGRRKSPHLRQQLNLPACHMALFLCALREFWIGPVQDLEKALDVPAPAISFTPASATLLKSAQPLAFQDYLLIARELLRQLAVHGLIPAEEVESVYRQIMDPANEKPQEAARIEKGQGQQVKESQFGETPVEACFSRYPPMSLVSTEFLDRMKQNALQLRPKELHINGFLGRPARDLVRRIACFQPPCRRTIEIKENAPSSAAQVDHVNIDCLVVLFLPSNDFMSKDAWTMELLKPLAKLTVDTYLSACSLSPRTELTAVFWEGVLGKIQDIDAVNSIFIQSYFQMDLFDRDMLEQYVLHLIVANRYAECALARDYTIGDSLYFGHDYFGAVRQSITFISLKPVSEYECIFYQRLPAGVKKKFIHLLGREEQ